MPKNSIESSPFGVRESHRPSQYRPMRTMEYFRSHNTANTNIQNTETKATETKATETKVEEIKEYSTKKKSKVATFIEFVRGKNEKKGVVKDDSIVYPLSATPHLVKQLESVDITIDSAVYTDATTELFNQYNNRYNPNYDMDVREL